MPARTPRHKDKLQGALHTVRSPAGKSAPAMLAAAEFLVACGRFDEAELGLRQAEVLLRQRGVRFASMELLKRANRRLREAGVRACVAGLGDLAERLFSSEEEAILSTAPDARTLLVVFASMYGDLWISLPVLHCLLPTRTVTVLYLKDPTMQLFLRGLSRFGDDFDALCDGIRKTAADLALSDIRVMSFSSGGYGGLLAAARIRASGFLGFSAITNIAEGVELPRDSYISVAALRDAVGHLVADLKPLVAETGYPGRGVLYYGEKSRLDAAQAINFKDVPGFAVHGVPGALHNSVMNLIAEGRFDGIVRKFLA